MFFTKCVFVVLSSVGMCALTFLIDVEYQGTHITLTVGMGPCTRMALLVRYAPKTDRVVAVRCQLEEERE